MSQPFRCRWSSCFFFFDWSENANFNFLDDIEILLPVKICWIPFSGFRGEVENVSANGQGSHIVFRIGPKNTYLVEDVWSCSGFRGKVKNVSAKQRPGGHLVFRSTQKTHLVEDVEILIPVKIVKFQKKKSKMSQPIRRQGGHIVFRPENN